MSSFLREFISNWQTTGAISPSSPALAAEMMRRSGAAQAENILELGPGTGAFTEAVQPLLRPDASYLGIEINETFVRDLQQRFPTMNFAAAAAQEFDFQCYLKGSPGFDTIISGLPWTAFPAALQTAILNHVLPHLRPGGSFVTFAYCGFHLLPSGQRFRKLLRAQLPQLSTSPVIWKNTPPAFVYTARH
jgi:phosphatidylethanolamine/phosphatidyl-N-methylethanolamine N-methyltransferase